MKNYLNSFVACFIGVTSMYAQQNSIQAVDFTPNQVSTVLAPQYGVCMQDIENYGGAFEYPAGSLNDLSYYNSIWFGGKYSNDSIEFSGILIPETNFQLGNGPLSVEQGSGNGVLEDFGDASIDSTEMQEWAEVYKVSKIEVEMFKQWFQCEQDPNCNSSNYYPNYNIPNSILNWPAHGDVSQNQAYYLAPFFDYNNDGDYNPSDGDFPCIKGDYFAWMILNDQALDGFNQNGMGIEIHVSTYGFRKEEDNVLDKTIFVEYDVINRSRDTLIDFRFLQLNDFDIGEPWDDYLGTVPKENAIFAYNGDNFDEGIGNAPGYPNSIPILSMKLLNKNALYGSYIPSSSGDYGFPTNKLEYNNIFQGLWKNGDSLYYGGVGIPGSQGCISLTTNWIFPHLSTIPFNWTATNVDGQGGSSDAADNRGHLVAGGDLFLPGTLLEFDYAFIVSDSGEPGVQDNIDKLFLDLPFVQNFYDDSIVQCNAGLNGFLSSDDTEETEFSLYPNPTNSQITISTKNKGNVTFKVFDFKGSVLLHGNLNHQTVIDVNNLKNGIYIIEVISSSGHTKQKRFVKM